MEVSMLVRDRFEELLAQAPHPDADGLQVQLPGRLKRDLCDVRTAMFIRLAASRSFALGDRAGALRAAQNRSGRAFRLDVRQRVIVKALVSRHLGKGAARGAALAAHVVYLGRQGAGVEGERAEFFNRETDSLDARAAVQDWRGDRHHFRLIVSPENGERIRDLKDYVRDVMGRVDDGVGGTDAWSALTRGRLRTLEELGLATRDGRRFRLRPDMEATLRELEVRRDIIRTINQRRLESGRVAQIARPGRLSGEVVRAGAHDELGLRRFVIVRDGHGVEQYARVSAGAAALVPGQQVCFDVGAAGLAQVVSGRAQGVDLG
ncbi:DUF3363 domain-containing protein [Brevundimonas naejangsanensis]|uniref:DUF3363 domain-containing protein n=1 Tax=Brevundimonas naejangsanensis TaxID=588932 RepID=UPI003D06DE1C